MALVYLLPSDSLAASLGGSDNDLFSIDSATGIVSRASTLVAGTTYNVAYLVYDTTTGLTSGRKETISATSGSGLYLGPVTNAARVPNATLTGNQYARATTKHYIRGASPAYIQPVYAGYYSTGVALGNAQTLSLWVVDTAGNRIQAKFGGATSGTIPDGGVLIADPVYGTFAKDAVITLEPSVQVASGANIAVKEFPKATGYGEKFLAGNSPIADGYADASPFCIYPQAVLGPTTAPGVLIIGDSRAEKYFDTQDGTFDIGTVERHVGVNFGYVNIAISNMKASDYSGASHCARVMAKYCSVADVEIGVNNVGGGDSDATLQSQLAAVKANFADCPVWVLQTMTPETESSDQWKTVANQIAGAATSSQAGPRYMSIAGDDPRKANNRWRRSVPAGWAGCLDTAAVVQTAGSGGIEGGAWQAPSGNALTGDGIHELPLACNMIFTAIKDPAKTLFNNTFARPNTISAPGQIAVNTTTVLTATPNPSQVGANITFTATVAAATGDAKPTGSVRFKDGTNTIAAVALDNTGVAILPIASLSTGKHNITAVYTGNDSFNGSVSGNISQLISAPGDVTVITRHEYYDTTSISPTTSTLADGSFVLKANDKGPLAYDEMSSGNPPKYSMAGLGGKGALNYANTNSDFMFSNAPGYPGLGGTQGAVCWIFAIKTAQRSGTLTLISSDVQNGVQLRIEGNGAVSLNRNFVAGVWATGGGIIPDQTPIILAVTYNPISGAYTIRINGTQVAAGSGAGNFDVSSKNYTGANGFAVKNGYDKESYSGLMGAKVVLSAPTLAQIQTEERKYGTIFGITVA